MVELDLYVPPSARRFFTPPPTGGWFTKRAEVHLRIDGTCLYQHRCSRCHPIEPLSVVWSSIDFAQGSQHYQFQQFQWHTVELEAPIWPDEEPEWDPDSCRPRKGRWWDPLLIHVHTLLRLLRGLTCLTAPARRATQKDVVPVRSQRIRAPP